jgi:hypothetical protein
LASVKSQETSRGIEWGGKIGDAPYIVSDPNSNCYRQRVLLNLSRRAQQLGMKLVAIEQSA